MSWESSIKEFKYYLKVERSLADNSIQSYLRDINKLANYSRDIKKNEKRNPKLWPNLCQIA